MSVIAFFKTRTFLVNLLLAVVLITALVWGTFRYLNYYTLHGQSITVPDLTGLTVEEIESFIASKKLRIQVIDSAYFPSKAKGAVLDQDPEPFSLVKNNRTLYLTINSFHPPRVAMPRLTERSLRIAKIVLKNRGLKEGNLSFAPAQGTYVLSQKVGGKEVAENELVPKGAKVDLVVGLGISDKSVRVPLVLNLTLDSAIAVLQSYFLDVGAEVFDSTVNNLEDSMMAFVYAQSPMYSENSYLRMGSSVDLRLTKDSSLLDTITWKFYVPDTLHIPDSHHENLDTLLN